MTPPPSDAATPAAGPQPLWSPSPERVAATRLTQFIEHIAGTGAPVSDYNTLHTWSVAQPEAFWSAIWDHGGVIGTKGERGMERAERLGDTRFFPDAQLNFAENLLDGRGMAGDQPALIFRGEVGAEDVTWDELRARSASIAGALRQAGVEPGDRVAAWLPNIPDGYALMLGSAAIGATFTSTSPDFGATGVIERFGQTTPKVLVVTDGYHYGGKTHRIVDRVAEVVAELDSVTTLVVVPFLAPEDASANVDELARSLDVDVVTFADWTAPHTDAAPSFVPLPFDHPLYVLYSSGTTGKPKCIVHRAGGVLLKHVAEYQLQADIGPGDRVFYFTTMGWMMWNWLASGLAVGATLVLYDGNPAYPDHNRLFDLVDETGINLLGTSAGFLTSLRKAGLRPADTHDLSSVSVICSTGSPLAPEGFTYVYDAVSADVSLASMSGGTDLCACLVGGNPNGPVFAGELQAAVLGLDIDVVDDDGESCGTDQGELVCRNAFPSMPLCFWDDPDSERLNAAYYDRFPGLWHQGDFAARTDNGGFVISGRSDATLNPGGVRIGTAEIYRVLEEIDEVLDAIVVGQPQEADTRIVLFVQTQPGVTLDDALVQRIRSEIRTGASPRHVPAVVLAVDDLPRTRSGKLVELAVRDVICGREPKNLEALANPEALEQFKNRV